jgi:DNA-binding MarR family transcriptional regulator
MARDTTKRAEALASDLRKLVGTLTRRLRAESLGDDLNQSEGAVLARLVDHGASTTAALARAEWVTPQAMGATLAGLEEAGLVARAVDETDARVRIITITEKGRRVLLQGRAARQNWLARAVDQTLDADEQRALQSALVLLQRVVES